MEKGNKLITREMQIDEVIQKCPEALGIFMKYGLHCAGCAFASWENLEQGAQAHGLDEPTINKMIEEINNSLK
ncbi:MAG: DUF1858 domain-containing protein [archaeon]